jgi:hypothetical protein
MDSLALIIGTIALCLSVFCLLQIIGVVRVKTKTEDKYEKYRDPVTGLYRGKKNE